MRTTAQAAFDEKLTHRYVGLGRTRCGQRAVVTPGPNTLVDCFECLLQEIDAKHLRQILETHSDA